MKFVYMVSRAFYTAKNTYKVIICTQNYNVFIINKKTEDIKTFAKKLIKNSKSYEIVIKPLK